MSDQPIDLNRLIVPNPCTRKNDRMSPDQQVRQCEYCQKQVHNLAALTRDEIGELAKRAKTEQVCVQMRRRNGKLVTAETLRSRRSRQFSLNRRGFLNLAGAAMMSLIALIGFVVVWIVRGKASSPAIDWQDEELWDGSVMDIEVGDMEPLEYFDGEGDTLGHWEEF